MDREALVELAIQTGRAEDTFREKWIERLGKDAEEFERDLMSLTDTVERSGRAYQALNPDLEI